MIVYADDVPGVVRDACHRWERVYRLEAWDIGVTMADAFADDGEDGTETGAETTYEEPIRCAAIVVSRGKSDAEYMLFVAHEFLHLAHAGVDHCFHRMVDLLPRRDQDLARALYRDALERFVVDMTHLLSRGELLRGEAAEITQMLTSMYKRGAA